MAEENTAKPFRPIAGMQGNILPATAAFSKDECVLMVFPRPVLLTLDHNPRVEHGWPHQVQFSDGVQAVPVELRDHWYLKACGVKPVEQVQKENEAKLFPGVEAVAPQTAEEGKARGRKRKSSA